MSVLLSGDVIRLVSRCQHYAFWQVFVHLADTDVSHLRVDP